MYVLIQYDCIPCLPFLYAFKAFFHCSFKVFIQHVTRWAWLIISYFIRKSYPIAVQSRPSMGIEYFHHGLTVFMLHFSSLGITAVSCSRFSHLYEIYLPEMLREGCESLKVVVIIWRWISMWISVQMHAVNFQMWFIAWLTVQAVIPGFHYAWTCYASKIHILLHVFCGPACDSPLHRQLGSCNCLKEGFVLKVSHSVASLTVFHCLLSSGIQTFAEAGSLKWFTLNLSIF